ncbi:MAG TPA: iron uptake transporter deferrochelatase/peroxidase subunit [Pseudonocardiaceae bacterium]|nr:iron uptake transporter deferrochelatase/peroxidase subunit [Pseudonocardiaceae bacterium]
MTDGTGQQDAAGQQQGNVSRRRLLASLGVLGAAGVAGGGFAGGYAVAQGRAAPEPGPASVSDQIVPFRTAHQGGIATAQQAKMVFAAFQVTTKKPAELRAMLRDWTTAAEAMTRGQLVPGQFQPEAPPPDTGETAGLTPANLTVTFGYGPGLFDRFGLASRRPAALAPLPPLPLENFDPAFTGGDIAVQACADDPTVAFHAVRNLARIAIGTAVPLWMESGFGRTASTGPAQATPRNLMGFKDGTRNIRSDQHDLLDQWVWIGADAGQDWLRGGTYLVTRRIQMFLNQWDRDDESDQEGVFGRYKTTGAPLTGIDEFDPPNFTATQSGRLVIPADAHIRLAAHETNNGLRILRRGYSFTDGLDGTGNLLAGLFFVAFMRDPQQFVTLQRKLGSHDGLREYISHIGGALFVCPPGLGSLPPGATLADQLFGTSA